MQAVTATDAGYGGPNARLRLCLKILITLFPSVQIKVLLRVLSLPNRTKGGQHIYNSEFHTIVSARPLYLVI